MLSRQNFTSNVLEQLSPNYVSDNFALIAALTAKDKFPLNMIVSPVQCWAGWDWQSVLVCLACYCARAGGSCKLSIYGTQAVNFLTVGRNKIHIVQTLIGTKLPV